MELILSVTLIWILSSTGGALRCKDSQTDQDSNCKADEQCAAAAIQDSHGKYQIKSCWSSSFCNQTFSYNFGLYRLGAFVFCCSSSGCNSHDVPHLVETKNNIKCFTCVDGTTCDTTVECVGNQDRCIRGSVRVRTNTVKVFGCASENLCEAVSELKVFDFLGEYYNFSRGLKCCGSSFCNSAWTVELNLVPLLLGLVLLVAC